MSMSFLTITVVIKIAPVTWRNQVQWFLLPKVISVVNGNLMPHAYVKPSIVKLQTYANLFDI